MPTLPRLKTGAVLQYPATRTWNHAHRTLHFVDGSEQRYRDSEGPLRRWIIRLDRLDEQELTALEDFFVEQRGRQGSFSFVDPWSEEEHSDCSLETESIELEWTGETFGRTTLIVRENRI
ncbi:MAG: DUF2460 domain-containing protein [Bryobacteraceae bacterium]